MADPSTLTGKVLWLRAKDLGAGGTSVTSWPDQSGLGNNATGTGGTVATAATPASGKAISGTVMGYSMADLGLGGWPLAAYSASSNHPSAPPENVVDGNGTTDWSSADGAVVPQWIQIKQNGTLTAATSYSLLCRSSLPTQAPRDWTFQGSSDGGTTWTTLDTRTGVTFVAGTAQTFTFTNTTAYTYYRLYVTATNGATAVGLAEITLNGVANAAGAQSNGELWVVLKSDGGSGPQSWHYGTSGSASHYTYGGVVYDDTGSNTRRSFTPTLSVASWRLYRVVVNGTNWTAYLDNVSQLTTSTATKGWDRKPKALDTYSGQVAEILLFSRALTGTEAADLITYFNTEHGLTVAGGSASGGTVAAVSGTSGTISSRQGVSGTVTAVSGTSGTLYVPPTGTNYPVSGQADAASAVQGAVTLGAKASGTVAAVSGVSGTISSTSISNPTLGAISLSAKASLTATLPTITLVPLTVSLAAKASLSVATRPVKMFAFSLEAKADLRVTLPRHQTVDPVTGLPQYRLLAVSQDGTALGELPRAEIGDHTTGLALDDERLTFTLPKYDAGNRIVTARKGDPVREVQLWRGPNLEAWVKVDGDRPGDGVTEYDCSSLAGYLKGRVVGRTPKTDWLINGDFSNGEYGWSFGYEAGSKPAAAPTHEVVAVDFFGKAARALKLGGSDVVTEVKTAVETAAVFVPNEATYLDGGEAKIQAAAANIPNGTDIHIVGHTAYNYLDGDYGDGLLLSLNRARAARATLAAMGKGFTFSIKANLASPNMKDTALGVAGRGRYEPVASNDTYAGQAKNRRVEFSYAATVTYDADAAQYAQGSLVTGTLTVPVSERRALPIAFRGWAWLDSMVKASKAGYGVYIQIAKASAPTVIIEEAHSTLDETTPVQTWDRHRAEVTVPADGVTYVYTVRLYAPKGAVLWTEAGVYPAEALNFPDTDRALIVKGLVEHAQDPAMGKVGDTPILLGTRTPLTGKKLSRAYPFYERRQILDAIGEHTAVFDGVDLSMDQNTREIVTHFPWRGQRSGVTFELGSNISAYEAPTSVTDAVTRAITQGLESSGADREEGIVTDMTGLGGLLVERVNYAEPETPVTELEASSQSAIVRAGHPVTDLTVTVGRVGQWDPALTSWMLDHVGVGDLVDVVIIDGTTSIVGPHRVIRRILTPDTDTLRYALAPEPEEA